jgi:hypothetical protein
MHLNMKNSQRFKDFKKNIDFLTKQLLPSEKPSGDYTLEEQTLLRSHRILVHAEIESYFEDIAINKVTAAIKTFKKTKKASHVLAALCAYSQKRKVNLPEKYNDKSEKFLEERLVKEINHFNWVIQENHGILQKNILQILLPIGICESDIDPTLLIDLDQLGKERGKFAHSPIYNRSIKSKQKFDPSIEQKRIADLWIPEIQKIDSIILRLR